MIFYPLFLLSLNERFCFCQYRVRTGDFFISVKNRLLLPASYYYVVETGGLTFFAKSR